MKYKLSEQGQTTVVALFQKGLALMKDVSEILEKLEFKFNDFGELDCTNPELCQISQEELDLALEQFKEETLS